MDMHMHMDMHMDMSMHMHMDMDIRCRVALCCGAEVKGSMPFYGRARWATRGLSW